LILDGHGSCWNLNALKFLSDNQFFMFFLASHTSIWSQLNDAGVIKRFHSVIEKKCQEVQCTVEVANIKYFNTNFVKGWRLFLQMERDDLQNVGINNTTQAFCQTGLFPYNPFSESWSNAIETIGCTTK